MAAIGLRALAFAFIGFTVSAPAYAGPVDDARQLFFADVTTSYNKAVDYLDDNNTNDGKSEVERLQGYVEKLYNYSVQVGTQANGLAPILAEAWSSSASEIYELKRAVETLKGQVGSSQFRLDDLKSRFERTGSALEKSNAKMQDFGKKFDLVMGRVESAIDVYEDAITDAYDDAVDYLDDNNTTEGAKALEKLVGASNQITRFKLQLDDETADLSPFLTNFWFDASRRISNFNVQVGVLSTQVGKSQFNLGDLKDGYKTLGEQLKNAQARIRAYGERFDAMCNSCR